MRNRITTENPVTVRCGIFLIRGWKPTVWYDVEYED